MRKVKYLEFTASKNIGGTGYRMNIMFDDDTFEGFEIPAGVDDDSVGRMLVAAGTSIIENSK